MNSYSFRQVFDKANRRVRGLWFRNGSYYVQCTITHPATGKKTVTKLRLENADTLEQAKIEAAKVKDNASKGIGTFGPLGPTCKAYRKRYKTLDVGRGCSMFGFESFRKNVLERQLRSS